MIITSRKDFDGLVKTLRGKKKVFLLGCGECSTQCKTGGEDDLREMSEKLAEAGIATTGGVVVEVFRQRLGVNQTAALCCLYQ